MGYWYLNGFYTEKDLEEVAYWIQKAADQKDPYAECKIGYMYEKGLYFNADLDVAEKWYERSLRKPCTAYTPEYIGEQLNPEYLKMYDSINNEALKGLVCIEEKRPKRGRWQFWKK